MSEFVTKWIINTLIFNLIKFFSEKIQKANIITFV